MPKTTTLFECSHCTAQFSKWSGRCLECGKWGSVMESDTTTPNGNTKPKSLSKPTETKKLSEVKSTNHDRIKTNITELDNVLGGGFVRGSFVLLGGEPGIGKSTLALELASSIAKTLYFSGEESPEQIKLRSERLKTKSATLEIANTTDLDAVLATIEKTRPTLAIIDSVQTFGTSLADGSPGSITQVRACTARLMETAKTLGIIIVLIGHVTKDGTVAGPKTLEHMVDTVLYLEGDANHELRLLRAVKNRFGSTDEVGMFEMREDGLGDMKNVSEELLRERGDASPGSVVTCLIEGTRPILIEVQALVNKTVFGYPVRKASGFDINRLHVLIAVLERRAGLNLSAYDVHLNIVGGVRADEPATDLAVCLAIASAYKDKPLAKDIAAFGEVGLAGEVRSVRFTEKRLRECAKLGMKKVYTKNTKFKSDDIQIVSVKNIQDLISHTK